MRGIWNSREALSGKAHWAGKPAVISCVESLRVARHVTAMDPFLVLLHSLSGSLSNSDLMELKFLCRERVGKRKLERMQSGLDLFSVLLEQNDLERNRTGLLRELLASLRRHDLLQRLDNFEAGLAVSAAPGEAGGLGGREEAGEWAGKPGQYPSFRVPFVCSYSEGL